MVMMINITMAKTKVMKAATKGMISLSSSPFLAVVNISFGLEVKKEYVECSFAVDIPVSRCSTPSPVKRNFDSAIKSGIYNMNYLSTSCLKSKSILKLHFTYSVIIINPRKIVSNS